MFTNVVYFQIIKIMNMAFLLTNDIFLAIPRNVCICNDSLIKDTIIIIKIYTGKSSGWAEKTGNLKCKKH